VINKIVIKNFLVPQDYSEFSFIQDKLYSQVLHGEVPGYLLFLEYKDVFTVGRFAKNFDTKVKFIRSTRGGDITFHGLGQQIVYPILNIKSLGINLRQYIDLMHNFLIKFLYSKDIIATRNSKGPGLWVDDCKISFLGVAINRGITRHGASININCNLNNFKLINPCGDPDIIVGNLTALKKIQKGDLLDQLSSFFLDELDNCISYSKKKDISL